MSALGLSSAAGTSSHLSVKAADDRHPHDVLLVLRLGVLQDDWAVTVWAASGERNVNLLIHPARNRPCRPLSVGRTGLAARRLGVGLGSPLANGAALRLLARNASSSCFRRPSFSASARSNCRSRDAILFSSSFSRSEEPLRSGACIHLTMAQTRRFVQPRLLKPCVYCISRW